MWLLSVSVDGRKGHDARLAGVRVVDGGDGTGAGSRGGSAVAERGGRINGGGVGWISLLPKPEMDPRASGRSKRSALRAHRRAFFGCSFGERERVGMVVESLRRHWSGASDA